MSILVPRLDQLLVLRDDGSNPYPIVFVCATPYGMIPDFAESVKPNLKAATLPGTNKNDSLLWWKSISGAAQDFFLYRVSGKRTMYTGANSPFDTTSTTNNTPAWTESQGVTYPVSFGGLASANLKVEFDSSGSPITVNLLSTGGDINKIAQDLTQGFGAQGVAYCEGIGDDRKLVIESLGTGGSASRVTVHHDATNDVSELLGFSAANGNDDVYGDSPELIVTFTQHSDNLI